MALGALDSFAAGGFATIIARSLLRLRLYTILPFDASFRFFLLLGFVLFRFRLSGLPGTPRALLRWLATSFPFVPKGELSRWVKQGIYSILLLLE